jgi:hypothetical protein
VSDGAHRLPEVPASRANLWGRSLLLFLRQEGGKLLIRVSLDLADSVLFAARGCDAKVAGFPVAGRLGCRAFDHARRGPMPRLELIDAHESLRLGQAPHEVDQADIRRDEFQIIGPSRLIRGDLMIELGQLLRRNLTTESANDPFREVRWNLALWTHASSSGLSALRTHRSSAS